MESAELSVFFRPNGIAVIGASRIPGKLGYGVVSNLLEHRYDGPIYPVNPTAEEILGLRVIKTVADVPDPVDLAVLVVPAKYVATALEDCGKRGIKGAIIISGGFREVGPDGAEREAELVRIAGKYNMAVLGPNCIGTIDTHTPLNTTFVTGIPRPGSIALVSQSGAVAAALIDWAMGAGVGFSRIVSLGNQAQVTEAQMLEAVALDDRTEVITAYIEGITDGRAFLDITSRITPDRPIIALKVGRSGGGKKAVASHTGALAGSEAAYDAAFRRAGVLRASKLEEMLDWARALAWQPLPEGNRVAILTNAGGPGIMALDALESYGMQLAPLTERTREYLQKRVPDAASVQNPVDILAGSGPATIALCLDALLDDETVDAVVVITAPQDWFAPVSLAEVVGEVGNSILGRRKPILAAIMGLASTSDATQVLHRRKIPNFAFPERVGSTLSAMWQRKQWLESNHNSGSVSPEDLDYDRQTAVSTVAAGLAVKAKQDQAGAPNADSGGWMPPEHVDTLLSAYGIPVPKSGLAAGVEESARIAESIGFPVVIKAIAEGLTHKSDVGGIVLNLDDADSVRAGAEQLIHNLQKAGAKTEGFLVQGMVRGEIELIVGAVRDPQFGPLVMAGSGGTQVELHKDVAFALAPLTREQAHDLLNQTTAGKLLDGFRGAAVADREAVVDVIVRLAALAENHPEIAEVEINPLMVRARGDGATAVDARFRLG